MKAHNEGVEADNEGAEAPSRGVEAHNGFKFLNLFIFIQYIHSYIIHT
jgi:hypothetical protein